jgi:hypothetical protein
MNESLKKLFGWIEVVWVPRSADTTGMAALDDAWCRVKLI